MNDTDPILQALGISWRFTEEVVASVDGTEDEVFERLKSLCRAGKVERRTFQRDHASRKRSQWRRR